MAGSGGAYEFTPHQNVDIDKTAARTRLWGIVSLAGGIVGILLLALFIVVVAMNELDQLGKMKSTVVVLMFGFLGPLALVYAIVGKLYIDAGNALRSVVQTRGSDVHHLMNALDKVANAFRLEVIMSVVGFGLGFVLALLSATGTIHVGGR